MSGTPTDRPLRICVTVCTRERPAMLRRCLDSVLAQEVPPGVELTVAAIENDTRAKLKAVVEAVSATARVPVAHVLEPELGIPFARTRCGRHAAETGADFALYVDDDEEARPGWLAAFVAATRRYEADVYYGRVIPVYPEGTPAWMVKPDVNKRPTGTRLKKAEGHNTLVSTRVFRPVEEGGMGLSFDGSLRFSGGSDTEFFSRVADRGGRIVWIAEAEVNEIVPASRMTVRWQLRRAFRVAVSLAQVQARRRGPWAAAGKSLARGVGRTAYALTVGLATTAASLPFPERRARHAFETAKLLASAAGSLSWLLGVRPEPYRRIDGG